MHWGPTPEPANRGPDATVDQFELLVANKLWQLSSAVADQV